MSSVVCFSSTTVPSVWQHQSLSHRLWSLESPRSPPTPKFGFTSSFARVRCKSLYGATSNTDPAQRDSYANAFCVKKDHEIHIHRTKPSQNSQHVDEAQVLNTSFDWFNQWYPLSLITDLELGKPNAVQLLDTDIVVWRATQQGKHTWAAFYDRCPHRFAALSQGRINPTTNTLECGYHGWQFNSKGECSVIPQSENAPSVLACATALPCVEQSGILFVWMGCREPHPDSRPAFIDDVRAKYITSAYSRILPLCFTTLLQNVLDPAHIHFAHHGQIGRRELAAPIPVRILRSQTTQGFTADYYDGSVRLRYRPPCLVEIVTSSGNSFAYYAVPVTSGLVRTFALRGTSRRPLFRVPPWFDHIQRNRLAEGDLQLMITQQREMRKASKSNDYAGSWGDFYMPTSSDRLIIEMKRWLDHNAPPRSCGWFNFCDEGHVSTYKSRLMSHTRECASCSYIRHRLILLERVAAVLIASAITCGVILSNEMEFVLSPVVGSSVFLFAVSRGLRKRLE